MSTTTSLPARVAIRALGDESEVTITTPDRDLMADTIDPMGMDLERYLNGTRAVNFAHDHGRLPVGKTLNLSQTPHGIRARFKWSAANPEAAIVRGVFEEGVLGASVEFVPIESAPNRSGGVHYAKSILTGWALTGNPANPRCTKLLKSLGFASDEPVLILHDDPDDAAALIDVADLPAAWDAARRRSALRVLGRADTPIVFALDDEPDPAEEPRFLVNPADVRAAVEAALRAAIDREVKAAVGYARGRVD